MTPWQRAAPTSSCWEAKEKGQMIGLVFFLLLLGGCQSKPGLDELVRDCQNRNGMPNVRGEFKCEMPQDNSDLSLASGSKPDNKTKTQRH
jgi:hypothetical protein